MRRVRSRVRLCDVSSLVCGEALAGQLSVNNISV